MNLDFRVGLRGKLFIIIILGFVSLLAVLTLATSSYIEKLILDQYIHTAESIASVMETHIESNGGWIDTDPIQRDIDALAEKNPEISRISVYAHVRDDLMQVVASSDRSRIGNPADPNDVRSFQENSTLMIEKDGGDENNTAADQSSSEENEDIIEIEVLAPLHAADGRPIASVGIHLDMTTRGQIVAGQQRNFAIVISLGMVAFLPLLYLALNRIVIHPVKQLTRATRSMGLPDWQPLVLMGRGDEIGDLAKAFDETARSLSSRQEEVKLLLEASVAVSSALHVDKILQLVSDKISSSRMVTYCRVSLLDESGEGLEIRAASPTRNIAEWRRGIGHTIDLDKAGNHAAVIASGQPAIMRRGDRSERDSAAEWEWALTDDTESALLLPLTCKDETIGVVTLGELRDWERTSFSEKKIEFYQTLMNQASMAIDNARLYEKMEWHVGELSAMHDMSQAFTSTLDYQEVVGVVAQRVGSLIGAQFASVLLPDEHNRYLKIVASYNLGSEYIWTVNRKRRIPIGVGPLGKAFTMQRPFTVTDVMSDPAYGLWKHIATAQGYSSLIALPLMAKDQSIGVICIYFAKPRTLRRDEISLLTTSANEAAIAIDNARVYENLHDAFVGTIRSLAETIDAKDAYTRGHSEKVSLYSEAIARALGLEGDKLRTIRYAGYLHDVGKIGIPDAILSKPGKLTDDEYRVIKKHPVVSERILKPVNFPLPVQSIVRHHHERYDGRGYPDNLSAEEIPLGARILFVADAYEAMTSDRPYRKALSMETALAELKNNCGTQFDPRIVAAFEKIIAKEGVHQRGEIRLRA